MKSLMTLVVILSASLAQARSLNCQLTNYQDQVLQVIAPIAADVDVAKTTVASMNGVNFIVALTGKQVELSAHATQGFGFSSLSSSSKKKAGMKATLNDIEFKFSCKLEK